MFEPGDKVVLSKKGVETFGGWTRVRKDHGYTKPPRFAVVTGVHGDIVSIRKEGRKHIESFHRDFLTYYEEDNDARETIS